MAAANDTSARDATAADETNAADDTVRWPEDSTCIELDQPDELNFWSRRLHVSAGMLRRAVRIVGCRFKDVTEFLFKKRVA